MTTPPVKPNGASDNREALQKILGTVMDNKQIEHPALLCPKHEIEATIQDIGFSATFDDRYASGCICAERYPSQVFDWNRVDMRSIISREEYKCGEMHSVVQESHSSSIYCPVYFLLPRAEDTIRKQLQPTMGEGENARLSKSKQHYLPLLIDRYTGEVLAVLRITLADPREIGSGVRIAKGRCHYCIMYQVAGSSNIFNRSDNSVIVEIGIKKPLFMNPAHTNFKVIYTAYSSEITEKREEVQSLDLYATKMEPYPFVLPQSIWTNSSEVLLPFQSMGTPYLEEPARYSQLDRKYGENLSDTSSLSSLLTQSFDDENQSCDSRIPAFVSESYSEETLVESKSSVDLSHFPEDLSPEGIALDVSVSIHHEIVPDVDDIMNPCWFTAFPMGNEPFEISDDQLSMHQDIIQEPPAKRRKLNQ